FNKKTKEREQELEVSKGKKGELHCHDEGYCVAKKTLTENFVLGVHFKPVFHFNRIVAKHPSILIVNTWFGASKLEINNILIILAKEKHAFRFDTSFNFLLYILNTTRLLVLKSGEDKVIAATAAGESRVCLGVIPVKVRAKNGDSYVETYALLDSGSEVTLCQEERTKKLQFYGKKMNFTLTGMTGSQNVESQLVDIVVESMDGTTCETEWKKSIPDLVHRQMQALAASCEELLAKHSLNPPGTFTNDGVLRGEDIDRLTRNDPLHMTYFLEIRSYCNGTPGRVYISPRCPPNNARNSPKPSSRRLG
ncbi:Hypothetical predicted protein, partial [Paramuricea clavata]